MKNPIKIIIVGNGFGGIYTLKNLHKLFHNNKNIEITLIGEKNYFLFTPLLHEVATGGINPGNIIQPIRNIVQCCLKDFHLGKVEFINTKEKFVHVGGNTINYDFLVVAPGSETNFYNTPGVESKSLPLKSIDDAIKIKNHIISQMECALHTKDCAERKKKLTFVIVGGGPTGVELVAELQELIKENFSHFYAPELIKDTSIVLIQKGPTLVPQFNQKIQEKSLQILHKNGVRVLLNTEVTEISSSEVYLNNNEKIPTKTVIWVAGVKPRDLNFDINIANSASKKLLVNEYLQLIEHKDIFAIGDNISMETLHGKSPTPALAQAAHKEAVIVAKNIYALINKKPLHKFIYKSSGTLMSIGQWMAVGELFNITISGRATWWLWRTVYLSMLISTRKKVEVAIDWTINLFSPRDISQF